LEVGDYVYLKVSPTKDVQRFGVKVKLASRYIGPYEVIEACGLVACRIQLPEWFSAVHNVFHVTKLKKGVPVPENEVITEANAWIKPDFSLIEHPQIKEEATWEMEAYINTKYPGFLQSRNRESLLPKLFFSN
jgi:hypothetical protein